MPEQKEYLSKEKYAELQKELAHLQTVKRKEIAEQLEYAKSLGDLRENTEYQQAREDQAAVEDRISNLEALLKGAEILSTKKSDVVAVGSGIVIQKQGTTDERKYRVVGSEEADSSAGKISNKSPLGSALIGTKKGDTITVKTPNGEAQYKILSVE
ncbi:MAG TPA: transcription elongation factor GreA [Candidatus Paceibacterota bacterium]|nr:transcription elongation factor GreA [Candidatus Paceibacterota bacterium]